MILTMQRVAGGVLHVGTAPPSQTEEQLKRLLRRLEAEAEEEDEE